MGCFSYKCKKCRKGVNSTSFMGEMVNIYLLKDGKVIQEMSGEYDSYGRVFADGTQRSDVEHSLRESLEWEKVDPNLDEDAWSQVCDLSFANKGYKTVIRKRKQSDGTLFEYEDFEAIPDKKHGIAFIHTACYDGVKPKTRSSRDPDQGWGPLRLKHANMNNPDWVELVNKKKKVTGWSTEGSGT